MSTVNDLLKLLNLKIGEEFYIYDIEENRTYDYPFKFSDTVLLFYNEQKDLWIVSGRNVFDFFTGKSKIIKKHWKPKYDETYYYISSDGTVDDYQWTEDNIDLTFYAARNCFETKEDAESHRKELINYLESTYKRGVSICDIK